MYNGIDVSKWQGKINWSKAKKYIDFAIIRAGYGKGNVDEYANYNIEQCEKYKIPYGLYWFSYAYNKDMAEREADYLLRVIGYHKPEYPLYFDFEYDSVDYAKKNGVNITKTLLKSIATSFCEHLEKNGFYAGIYTNEDYIKNKYPSEIFDRFDLWYARYNTEPNRDVNLWQKSSTGKISGINGNVDLDVAYIDFPSLMKEKHLNGW